jgi:uncharacterized DUF497 family protein
MLFSGFDWDHGNIPKVFKHGVTRDEIESIFRIGPFIQPDLLHSDSEERFRAVGKSERGHYVFIVFTIRSRGGHRLIRPISARFMHAKEIAVYEKAISDIQNG